jgi:hypothetical protein
MSVLTRATRRNIPKDTILHSHRHENLKSFKKPLFFRYRAKVVNVGPSGTLAGTVGKNSMTFRGRVDYTGNICTVTSVEVKVTGLEDVTLNLTGLYPFNWILSKIATSITSRSKLNMTRAIEDAVGNQIHNNLKQLDCQQYFPEHTVTADESVTDNVESRQNEL